MIPRALVITAMFITTATVTLCTDAQAAASPELDGVVRLVGERAIGHACPVSGGYLLTNAHLQGHTFRWSDGPDDGSNEGLAEFVKAVPGADLVVLRVTRGRTRTEYRIASKPPAIGDRVYVRGYKSNSRRTIFAERRVETRVVRLMAGHLVYEDQGFAGSSGSCVLNDSGEAVAINQSAIGTDDGDSAAGKAVGLWGEWLKETEVDTVQ